MNTTKQAQNIAAPDAGDDGEAVPGTAKTTDFTPNLNIAQPADAGWFVAVVRVNCEKRIADLMQYNLNHDGIWFEYWVPEVKTVVIDKRTNKRKIKEKIFLTTFIFCRISRAKLDHIRFRSDVYKMLTMPGQSRIHQIPDAELNSYRRFVEDTDSEVSAAPVPLKKGVKVRIMGGNLKGLEAYVQSYNGKQAVIGNEIRYISGATIKISRQLLEVVQ